MSNFGKEPIGDAAKIIDKFGGIRPMSNKIGVAVTTIQGWKKRGVIPAARKEMLLQKAGEHNVDLSEFFDDAPEVEDAVEVDDVNDDGQEKNVGNAVASDDNGISSDVVIEAKIVEKSPIIESKENSDNDEAVINKTDEFASHKHEAVNKNFTEIAIETEKRAITKSALIAVAIVFLTIVAIISMLWPDFEEFDKRGVRISALEGDISDIKHKQSSFKGFVPENWVQQLEDLKEQVSKAKDSVSETVGKVTMASKELIEANGLEDRVVKLQGYVSEIANSSGIFSLLSRFDFMEESDGGQNMLDNAVLEVSSLMQGLHGKDDSYINSALNLARSQSTALQETLGNVPQEELKAAAMLLALTQVRSALNRSDEAFDSDLGLLMNMVGDDNIELKKSLDKLAPNAKTGVLSAAGLQDEFRTIAGDVVAASLSGEDVSFTEKAAARMNNILKIEKDGELVSGTETQAKVNKAENLMKGGNLGAALKYLNSSLSADELDPLRPWIKSAEAVLASQKVKKLIEQAIEFNTGRGLLGGSQLLKDE